MKVSSVSVNSWYVSPFMTYYPPHFLHQLTLSQALTRHEIRLRGPFNPLPYSALIDACERFFEYLVSVRQSSLFFHPHYLSDSEQASESLLAFRRDAVACILMNLYVLAGALRGDRKVPVSCSTFILYLLSGKLKSRTILTVNRDIYPLRPLPGNAYLITWLFSKPSRLPTIPPTAIRRKRRKGRAKIPNLQKEESGHRFIVTVHISTSITMRASNAKII